ncbi:hypothetical protein M758_3G177800 [Ceratodon purpureus]|uniref:Uncharacterized protein n=1 Tax=Ceratodon purpureus TaxID=3225 RepID=A0A8T0HZV4_CERPU|nr:hypothetical protein KC19_5G042300 [Ceratodon purpureus]KAG0623481.1 hypothetical protein M758_3G177800 [Ceratodon purpureus]
MSSGLAISSILFRLRSRNDSIRSPSKKLRASTVFRSLLNDRHCSWLSPPTPLITFTRACWSFCRNRNCSWGSDAITPITPFTVTNSSLHNITAQQHREQGLPNHNGRLQ